MTKKYILKVVWICVMLYIAIVFIWYVAYAGELGKSPRQIYNDNRRIEHEGGVHTTSPIRSTKKKKRVFVYKCVDSETKEEVPCPEPEEKDPAERTYIE